MKSLSRKILWTSILMIVVAVVSGPLYLYYSGLQGLPEDRTPLTQAPIPKTVANTYWRYVGGHGDPEISAKNPYGLIFDFFIEAADPGEGPLSSAQHALLSEAARSLVSREQRYTDWHLSNGSALIWISRNWTVDEIFSTVFSENNFGNGFHGIESAASGYFGTTSLDMSEEQIVFLLAIRAAPSKYDPWCNLDNHRTRFEFFSRRIGLSTDYDSINYEQVPEGWCD